MANLNSVLNEQIRRLAKREITSQTRSTRKLTAQHRRDIAALKRQIAGLEKTVAFLQRQERRRVSGGGNGHVAAAGRAAGAQAGGEDAENLRFRRDGLVSHRQRLGLSAKDYGRLVGVSGLSIYHWESGKAKPRRAQVAKLAAIRGLGKREAQQRLELLDKQR